MRDLFSGFRKLGHHPVETESSDSCKSYLVDGGDDSATGSSEAHESHEVSLPEPTQPKHKKVAPRHSFLKLACHQRFGEILDILNRREDLDLDEWLFLGEQKRKRFRLLRSGQGRHNLHLFRGETPLHVILHYHPTEAVVDKLIEFLSSSDKSQTVPEDALDMLGRTPLHVGASKGCSSAVMSRLLSGVSVVMPAVAKDSSGRFALHWACANPSGEDATTSCSLVHSSKLRKNNDCASPVDNMVQVVFLLLKAYPEASTIPDDGGKTPLDLARAHGADPRIIQLVEESFNSCQRARAARTNGRPKYKSLDKHFKDMSITEASSDEDVPHEVSEIDYDEVSSIGSAGVSLYARKKLKESGHPWSLQVQRIEEAIEL